MGEYTELVLKCRLESLLPEQVKNVLEFLFNPRAEEKNKLKDLPDHPFFNCPRWKAIGSSSSYYHIPEEFNYINLETGRLFSRSDLKNYDDEIDKFIDWISPYLAMQSGDIIGWKCFEQCNPTFIYKE